MIESIFVTGATGSVGSNVCRLAAQQGRRVRALVRPGTDISPLKEYGVESVVGDVTDPDSLGDALSGLDGVVHCAAQIGGTWSTATSVQFEAVNQWGSINVLDAAERAGAKRTVLLLSAVLFLRSGTISERSPVAPIHPGDSAYLRTKRAAYYEGMARAARGSEISFVVPGGIYGPSPFIERALVPTIFTGTLLMAATGQLKRYLPMPISWVLAEDVADISLRALDQGRTGANYLAMGRPEDAQSLPAFCNLFLGMGAFPHRVAEFDPSGPDAVEDPEFGSMVRLLQAEYPEPAHDCSRTTRELGKSPTALSDGLRLTLDWLRRHGKLAVPSN
ncbi:MAG TPA: NAD-dependent epimerase/dehydratase family protein [Acidimicrobiales bacterium]|nr:NAD-dependent epimerase/dehydratase family protein [Acidimicrobiales bacterium]